MIDRYNPSSRYKNRAKQRFNMFIFYMLMFCGAIALGYWLGRETVAAHVTAQARQIESLQEETETLRQQMTDAKTEAQTSVMRYNQLQTEMEEIVPTDGPLRGLLELVKERLKEGTSAERLSFLIRSARPPRNCSDPNTKRFIVSTPAYQGPDSVISIDNGMVVVTAEGESAKNQDGQAEAWYDPGEPVNITFKKFGGEVEIKEGTLPMNMSMVVKDREYRFTLSSGARSFIKVTYDSCDYP
jgi:hypothetical protein